MALARPLGRLRTVDTHRRASYNEANRTTILLVTGNAEDEYGAVAAAQRAGALGWKRRPAELRKTPSKPPAERVRLRETAATVLPGPPQ